MNHIAHAPIFIAASLSEVRAAKALAATLRELKFAVTSTWHDTYNEATAHKPHIQRMAAVINHMDLEQANVLVLYTYSPSTTGGLHFEHGEAVAQDKLIVLIGQPQNIYEAACFMQFDNLADFTEAFKVIAASR